MAKIYSGIDYIDALLSDSGQPTTPVNSWSTATTVGSGVTLTYGWMTSAPANAPAGGFQAFGAEQQAGAITAMALVSEIANVSFNHSGVGSADIEFGTVSFGGSPSGFTAGLASVRWTILGNPVFNTYYTHSDVYLTNSFPHILDQTAGGSGFATMLHELGHALGLEHTFENRPSPAGTDSDQYSVMSYTSHPTMFGNPSTFQLHDIAALQYLYGANMTTRTGNDTYNWATNASVIETIWDAGGTDTIDASNQTRDATINLVDGSFSSIGENGAGGNANNNIAIAYNVIIENATGGSGSDTITGNTSNNTLRGNAGIDTIDGGEGGDTIIATTSDGNDTYTGGNGFDVLDFSAVGGKVQVDQFGGSVTGSAGNDTLTDIFEQVIGTNFDDVLAGGNGINVLDGNGGDDLFWGNGGIDLLRGGEGNDSFFAITSDGDDVIEGNAGFDILNYTTVGGVIQLDMFTNSTTGSAGNDSFIGIEYVIGSNFGDIIAGNNGINAFEGGGGADQLFGNGGIDWMTGGTGNDTITLGFGDDTLQFRMGDEVDTITDFVAGAGTDDHIDLRLAGSGFTSLLDMQNAGAVNQVALDTHIDLAGADQIILQNVMVANLHDDDFMF